MESHWLPAILQTGAVLIWCSRGLWRFYPAWTAYGIVSSIQSLTLTYFMDQGQRSAGIWTAIAPFLLLGLFDSVLELFVRLSELYRRFQRDRWRWLVLPVVAGFIAGMLLVYNRLNVPSNYYRGLFLAYAIIGSVCASVLLLGWIASIPVRIPVNLRKHLFLLAIYVGSSTLAYASYFKIANQQFVRDLLLFMPPVVMLAWSLLVDPLEERQREKAEMEMPESTLEQILGLLRHLS